MGKCHTILIGEDDENDFFLLDRAFSRHQDHLQLAHAKDGVHVMNYLAGAGEYADRLRYPMPDILLLDIKMPRTDGFQVLKWIRHHETLKHLIVVMFTSSKEERDIAQAFSLGANSYLMKPGNYAEYVELTQAFITFWLRWSKRPALPAQQAAVGICG